MHEYFQLECIISFCQVSKAISWQKLPPSMYICICMLLHLFACFAMCYINIQISTERSWNWMKCHKFWVKFGAHEKRAFCGPNATNVTHGWQVLQHIRDTHQIKTLIATDVKRLHTTHCDVTSHQEYRIFKSKTHINFVTVLVYVLLIFIQYSKWHRPSVLAHMSNTWCALIGK